MKYFGVGVFLELVGVPAVSDIGLALYSKVVSSNKPIYFNLPLEWRNGQINFKYYGLETWKLVANPRILYLIFYSESQIYKYIDRHKFIITLKKLFFNSR